MVWESEINELNHRRHLAEQMGGEEAVARHRERGKLTVRERIATLADPGSFQEIGSLAGSATYDGDKLVAFSPSNCVIGTCTLNGRRVVINGGDFTVRGGAHEENIASKSGYTEGMALDSCIPYVRLLDATGGSIRDLGLGGHPILPGRHDPGSGIPRLDVRLLNTIPVVSAVLGSVAGYPAVQACLSHFSVMVRGTSQIFVGGPPVVKAALYYDITKEELGGEKIQAYEGGVIDNVADNEPEAFAMIRRFLSYMPDSVWELPPRIECLDDPNRRDEELLSIVPRASNATYNAYKILKCVLDHDSFFEIAPYYGKSRIIGLARANGYPVGVMINNPMHLGGSMDISAGEKVTRFLQLCDTFHLPIVYFVDEPGFMVGLDSEKRGMVRIGARVSFVTGQTKVPWFSVIIRQAFGVAGAIHIRTGGMCRRYAWPSGTWGPMHIEGGATAAYRREIESAPDPEAKRKEIEHRMKSLNSPFRTAEVFGIEDIIDPRDTRPLLCDFIGAAQTVLKTQIGPSVGPSYRP
ncbi:MAG: acyl-CoA carboxylase subunit beta [Promethearchaeota archaeon]